ncbi:hypothetical protein PLESTB_001432500 [Pleodorina starrii]|uniref:Uncharacterized protein n=1 Tax=Pleodorina starrii TaxID=330485 RepID=A0A9W6F7C4_9CHLO|nr:hypothetical protein PLESTB_001432500 [Pleodorina starrii]
MLNGLGAVPGPMLFMKRTPAQINALKVHGETYQSNLRTMTGDDAARPVPGTMRSMLVMLGDTALPQIAVHPCRTVSVCVLCCKCTRPHSCAQCSRHRTLGIDEYDRQGVHILHVRWVVRQRRRRHLRSSRKNAAPSAAPESAAAAVALRRRGQLTAPSAANSGVAAAMPLLPLMCTGFPTWAAAVTDAAAAATGGAAAATAAAGAAVRTPQTATATVACCCGYSAKCTCIRSPGGDGRVAAQDGLDEDE